MGMADVSEMRRAAPAAGPQWQERELVAAYVGAGWEEYEETYQRLLEGRSGAGFDATLFFLPWIWLAYRKMYLAAVIVWLLDTVPAPVDWRISAATLLAHVGVAVYGKAFYLKRAMAEVAATRGRAAPGAPGNVAALDALEGKGAASRAAIIGLCIPLLLITILAATTDVHLIFD
jgi:hypothetical protein